MMIETAIESERPRPPEQGPKGKAPEFEGRLVVDDGIGERRTRCH